VQALAQGGQLAQALALAQQGLQAEPADARWYLYLGNILAMGGDWPQAAQSYGRGLALQPDHAGLLQGLAGAWRAQGQVAQAIEPHRRLALLDPGNAQAQLDLGSAQREAGQLDDAVVSLRRAISLNPGSAEAHCNMGLVMQTRGDYVAAVRSFREAIARDPGYVAAHGNLGSLLLHVGQMAEGIASLRVAMQLEPSGEAFDALGVAVLTQGRIDEAIELFTRSVELQPGRLGPESNRLYAFNYHPEKSADEIFSAYRAFEDRFARPLYRAAQPFPNERRADRRLRVGYVSPDFRRHPVQYFLQPLLDHHDHGAVEVFCYGESAIDDDVSAQYRRAADHWVPSLGLSDDALAQRIRDDRIDVLVDLAGHTGGNRLAVFAARPAPVSVSWLGFGYTTGLSAIDHFLTDAQMAPEGSEVLFAERPWRLPRTCFAYRPTDGMGAVGALPALGSGRITFCTLTRAVRVNDRVVRVWAEVLRRVPQSCLVIDSKNYQETGMQNELAARFAQHGIERDRLRIGFHSPPWDLLRGADIGLDCFPHNSGTTLFETLYMGLPYVTLAGRPSVGRLGATILDGLGHREWIAQSEAQYIDIAVALAGDLPRLAALRAGLRPQMQAGPLMDETGFARSVEAAYREMFTQWVGQPIGPARS
jgi:predicted O-linked N-acetylglucosamine transferase (SPINDLY family)